jgi:hypothetical protein
MDYQLNTFNNMAIDISKYGTPVDDNKGFIGQSDLSKYGTPATPTPVATPAPKPGFFSKIGTALGNLGKDSITRDESGKFSGLTKEASNYMIGGAFGFSGGSGATRAINTAKTLPRLTNTAKTLSKFEENTANLEGRIGKTLLGEKKVLPSVTEKNASNILNGQISGDITKNPRIIDSEIARRGVEAENYLAKNKVNIPANEQLTSWIDKRRIIEKSLDKTQLKAFDDQFRMFMKQVHDKKGVIDITSDKFYKALKDYEQNVARNLPRGMATLTDPTGVASAKIMGAKAVREIARDLLGSKHPEFKPKMFDLASLYDVLDTALTKSRQMSGNALSRFGEKHPVIKNTGLVGGGYLAGKVLGGGNKTPSLSNVNQIGNE